MLEYVTGVDIPPQPPSDYYVEAIINTFFFASPARKIVIGLDNILYLKLSVKDITDVVEVHDVPIPRSMLDVCILAIDAIFVEKLNSKPPADDKE